MSHGRAEISWFTYYGIASMVLYINVMSIEILVRARA